MSQLAQRGRLVPAATPACLATTISALIAAFTVHLASTHATDKESGKRSTRITRDASQRVFAAWAPETTLDPRVDHLVRLNEQPVGYDPKVRHLALSDLVRRISLLLGP